MLVSKAGRAPLLLFLSFFSAFIMAESKFTIVRDPKPTFKEGKVVCLEKVGELKEPIHMDAFLAVPSSLTMAPETETLYIYDAKQVKIFMYDKDLNLVKMAGRRGEGPGDIKTYRDSGTLYLQFANDRLYAYNDYGLKVIIFDKELRFIDEVRHKPLDTWFAFAVDECENYYFRNLKGGIWSLDRNMNVKSHLLDDHRVFEFLFFDPPQMILDNPLKQRNIYLKFDVVNGSTLVAYSQYTGQFFIFENNQLTGKFSLYSDYVLRDFKDRLIHAFEANERTQKRLAKRNKKRKGKIRSFTYSDIYIAFFVDKVSGRHFYVQLSEWKKRLIRLYCFNLDGKLEKTYHIPMKHRKDYMFFKLKGKDAFYATNYDSQVLKFTEKKNETY